MQNLSKNLYILIIYLTLLNIKNMILKFIMPYQKLFKPYLILLILQIIHLEKKFLEN